MKTIRTRWWIIARCHARERVFTSHPVSSPDTVQTKDNRWSKHFRDVPNRLDITLIVLSCLLGGRQSVLILWTWLGLSLADDQSIVVEFIFFVVIGVELLEVELVA